MDISLRWSKNRSTSDQSDPSAVVRITFPNKDIIAPNKQDIKIHFPKDVLNTPWRGAQRHDPQVDVEISASFFCPLYEGLLF